MKKIRLFIIFASVLNIYNISYGQSTVKNTTTTQNEYIQIDTSIISILQYNTIQDFIFKNCKSINLSNEDLMTIENILKVCINNYNIEQEKQFNELNEKHPEYKLDKNNFIIDLKNYRRQYFAIENINGEKEVWINCFCGLGNDNWKTKLIMVIDGGNCYFNLKINLTRSTFYELMVNGDA